MAKRRHGPRDEILMVPFLDILCSLIGVLVLIIVFLCVSQASQTEGRTQEEINRAIEYKKLNREQQERKVTEAQAQEKLAALKELEEKLAKLRMLLSSSDEDKKRNEQMSQDTLKQLDNLLLEIKGYEEQAVELKAEIAALLKELDDRKLAANTPPPVIVQPSGSGMKLGGKAFFVEASAGKILLYWDQERKTQLSSAAPVIVADTSYEHFLKSARNVPDAKIIFLVRDDGNASFNNAAGWALQTYGFSSEQIAKLPIPGRGAADLTMFKEYVGTIEPPPGAAILQPAPAAPSPAQKPPATPKA